MKKIIFPIFLVLSIVGFSQTLEKVAEIQVSYDTKVFTFKSLEDNTSGINDDVSSTSLNITQQKIVSHFLAINGVSEATYDSATRTYTITANKSTIINLPLNLK